MNYKQATKWVSSDWFQALASLLTLVTFVVGQSVYDVLASNQEFLAVRQVSNLQLLQIVLVFNLLPALALFLLWALCRRFHHALARLFLSAVSFVLFLAFFLQLHNTYLPAWDPFPHAYLLWLFPALLVGLASLQFEKPFRAFLLALSPVVFLFPGLFLYHTWTNPQKLLPAVQERLPSSAKKDLPPIFILVFDELTVHALLDEQGQIDGSRFPNFKKLADESHWFRNTTANAPETTRSIPAILTGNFALADSPSYEAYPNNLFSLLHPYYDIYAHEVLTNLCAPRLFHCPDAEIASSQTELLEDVFYLYATSALPKGANVALPDVTRTWGPFGGVTERMLARLERFQRFLNSLGSSDNGTVFHFFHHMLPHGPYALTSDGKVHERRWHFGTLVNSGRRGLSRKTIDQLYTAAKNAGHTSILDTLRDSYLEQVAYVDKEIGRFVARLKELDSYDKSLIIITADHGVSYKPEHPGRGLCRANADMILTVPLFIRLPFQTQGMVSDKDVQLIDIVPTVADLLGLHVPWQLVGRSVFGPSGRRRQKVAYSKTGHRLEFPDTLGLTRPDTHITVPKSPLVGQKIKTFNAIRYESVKGGMDTLPVSRLHTRVDGIEFPIYVHGWAVLLDRPRVPDQIAIAVNGEIVDVTTPCYFRGDVARRFQNPDLLESGWLASFSSERLRLGKNTITAYVVLDAVEKKLAILNARNNKIRVTRE